MTQIDPIGLAVLLVFIGLFAYLIVYLLGKGAPGARVGEPGISFFGEAILPDHGDAVMIVEEGGRIKTMNIHARQAFHLQDDEMPHLERLARKARPGEALLKLCAAEGQTRFVLDGRLVEGTSYQISASGANLVVVSLRHLEIASELSGGAGALSAQALQTFTELTQAMAASLNLDTTLQAILENVEKLMPADFMEVTLWDAESEVFVPYRFIGPSGVDRKLELAVNRYDVDHGFTGDLFRERKPLLISDIETRTDLRPALQKLPVAVRSYLGLPLMVGNEFIGTLELGSLTADAFREEDLDLVSLLSGQAAIAIHNALLYRAEQQRTAELTGLARLAQAFSSVRDPAGLFARLVESIAPLVDVEILGFLIYSDDHQLLEARSPFYGLPDPIVALYKISTAAGSPAEQILLEQDVLLTEDASEDEKWPRLGMDYLIDAASLRETALVPLATTGHIIGYLQASNHRSGKIPFTQAEMHLLTIVANQTASIIENAELVQQSRQRAQRSEALRRIVSLTNSAANLDEILLYSVQELARLLHADVGAVFLFDKENGVLKLHRPSVFGNGFDLPERNASLTIDDPQFHISVTGSQNMLTIGKASQISGEAHRFYRSILGACKAESAIVVPMIVQNEGIGELWLMSPAQDFFEQGDAQVVATAAGQMASVAEQSSLRGQTDESLRRRVGQLTAITRISRELSTSLDLNYLLNIVYDEALRTTRADCGTILLFDLDERRGELPMVRFFVGDMPGADLAPLERAVLQKNAPQSVQDFSHSKFDPPHAGIQSALIVPISYQQRTAGLICLHGKTQAQFDDTALEISQSLAVQAAVALNNALAFEDQTRRGALLRRELETLSRLVQVSRVLKPGQSLVQSLTEIGEAIRSATPFQAVVISVYEGETQALKRVVGLGLPPGLWAEMESRVQPWGGIQKLLKPDYLVGQAYFIPHNRKPSIPADVHIVSILPMIEARSEDAWHQDDLLFVPLFSAEGDPLGLVSVDAPQDNRRPDRPTYDALEVFAAQASMTIENCLRADRLERQVEMLERQKRRLEQSSAYAQSNMPLMLHKELEQAIALRELNQRGERIRTGLEIAAAANRQESEGAVLRTLASEMLTRFSLQTALIAERTSSDIRLIEVIGALPAGANLEALFGQRNPLRQMFQQDRFLENGLVLTANIESSVEWQNNTLLNILEGRSLVGLPLEMGDGRQAAVLVIGQRSLPPFLEEDRRVFSQLAHQVSVGLQNLQLLNETRRHLQEVNLLLDFSRKLASLTPENVFSTLVKSAVQVLPQVHSAWVGIWEEKESAIVPQAAVGYSSASDLLGIRYSRLNQPGAAGSPLSLPLRVFSTGNVERVVEVDFSEQYNLAPDNLLRYRKATEGRLPVSVMVVPLLVGESVLGVVFFENFDTPGAFNAEDEALALSFTRQAAMALENARLFQASERRAAQLQALTTVAGTITSSLQREALVPLLLEQLKLVLPYDTATLWLRSGSTLTVTAAAGFADNEMRLNLNVAVEDSALFRSMIEAGAPILVGDQRNDPRFPGLVIPEYLSWLGIPLINKSEVIGLIALEKREADFYTPDYVQAATAFASQAAVSLENARLYEESTHRAAELDERSQRLALLNRLSGALVASLDIGNIFQITGQQLRAALNAAGAAAVMVDAEGRYTLQSEVPENGEALPLLLPASTLFDRLQDTRGIFQTSTAPEETELRELWEVFLQPREVRSLLVVPLVSGAALQGWFLIYGPGGNRYAPPEIELARTVCNQAAIAIQNARLFAETHSLTEDLERRIGERTQALFHEHQNSQTLLHIITELSTSLEMNLVLNRTLEVLNASIGCEESLIILAQGVAAPYRAGLKLVEPAANAAENAAGVEQQIAAWVIRSRQPVLIRRVQEESRWEMPLQGVAYQSVLGVPLVMGEEILGALILFHRDAGFFQTDQIGLLEATARQIGIALNNAELFSLIRDQSEHMGSMLRDQQIEASRSRAILEAVADGVLVTDASGRVTLFNASAEQALNLTAAQVIGKSFDHFSGLFGKDALDWMRTIRNWSEDPSASQSVETYAEQLELDNGRVMAVHLAPVFWRQEFLGTVSIFRDITHEIQVDRLKSEFVANVSHELRTPMTVIKGYVDIMLMGAVDTLTPQQVQVLNVIKSNTERLGGLVGELLDVSRIEAGRVSLNLKALDIREIAGDVIADIQRRSHDENKPISIHLEAQTGLPFALGDAEWVRQVLISLVTNGYHYTPENGCLTVTVQEIDSEIQVAVRDNGIGIAPEVHHRIFERFYRGEDPLVLATAGTGLGLSIAKTLVEMHGGRIWFESSGQRGEGSVFTFTLPVYKSQE